MTEENKGAAVALPPTGWYGSTAVPEDTPLYTGQQMLAFRAEGEADLRARLAAAEAQAKRDEEWIEHQRKKANELQQALAAAEAEVVRLRAQRDEAVAALRVAVEDAADEWARHVVEDTAPRPLTNHMLREFDHTLASLKGQA